MLFLPHLLLVAGTGRNTGKTTFACSIIEKFSVELKVTGLKISSHFHSGTESLHPLFKNENFSIYRETSICMQKDSSKMLKAGADKVFYIECRDESIEEAFERFLQLADGSGPVVCESPSLRRYINPGLFIIVDTNSNQNKKEDIIKLKSKADLFIETDKEGFTSAIKGIGYDTTGWKIGFK
ncbi:MAG: hypothetical protein R2764_18095 [Bacteroidales bacterium]